MSKTKKTTNTSKATTSTKATPVNNNSKTKKTTLTFTDKAVDAFFSNKATTTTTKKMPPTHSAYHQLGKKRSPYSQNIWVIEESTDGKKWTPAEDSYIFYKSRDEARGDVVSLRSGELDNFRYRVAKYTFTAVSKA